MERKKLNAEEILAQLADLDYWKVIDNKLLKKYKFADFAEALAFVNQIGVAAETHNHHPDIKLGWGYVEICLTTHDSEGITETDFALAKEIDALGY